MLLFTTHYYWLHHSLVALYPQKTLERPLDRKESKPVDPKGNQPRVFIGRTDADAEAPVLWPPWCEEPTHSKRPWCWERLRAGEEGDNRVGWLDGITDSMDTSWSKLGDGEGQGRLACCSSRGHKESDTTEQLNNNHFVKLTDCDSSNVLFPTGSVSDSSLDSLGWALFRHIYWATAVCRGNTVLGLKRGVCG